MDEGTVKSGGSWLRRKGHRVEEGMGCDGMALHGKTLHFLGAVYDGSGRSAILYCIILYFA